MLLHASCCPGVGAAWGSAARTLTHGRGLRSCAAAQPARDRRLRGARCSAAPDGSRPRVPSPNKEDIKKAILGYPSSDSTTLAPSGSGGQAAGGPGQSAATVAVTHAAAAGAPAVEPGSWEDWKQHLEGLDETLQEIQTLDSELSDAVVAEDYRRAAQLKAKLAELEKQDVVGHVLREMDAALAGERYREAATLRDEGGVGLLGWWAGRGEDDAVGHVVKVTPEFGRYMAQAYTARELAEITGWSREMSLRDLLMIGSPEGGQRGGGGGGPGGEEDDVGLPVFEVAVRRDPQTGALEQQPVALFSPVDLQGMGDGEATDSMSSIVARDIEGLKGGVVMIEKDDKGEVLSISVEMDAALGEEEDEEADRDPISRLLSGGSGEGEDNVVSIDQLAGFFPSAQEPLDLRQYTSEGEAGGEEDDVQQQISEALQQEEAGSQEQRRDAGSSSGRSPSPLERLMASIEGRSLEGERDDDDEEEDASLSGALAASRSGQGGEATAAMEEELRYASITLQRAPAQIEWHSRDSFTIRASSVAGEAAELGEGAFDMEAAAAAVTAGLAEQREPPSGERAVPSAAQREAATPPAAPEGSGAPAGAADEQQAERLRRLEADVQQWAKMRGAKKEQIEAILRATMAAAIAQGVGIVASEPQPSPVGLEGMCSYSRIPTEHFCKTDPFSGLYLGAFGPHGPELLQLARVMMDGEEWVHATKVTGDRNVPAGEVSFRAKIARQHRLSASESYPLELGVKGRYKGQGRVAQEGFQHPKWVEGELLLLTAGNPMTHGAELGFVYNIDGVKRFLILFSRVDLDALDV